MTEMPSYRRLSEESAELIMHAERDGRRPVLAFVVIAWEDASILPFGLEVDGSVRVALCENVQTTKLVSLIAGALGSSTEGIVNWASNMAGGRVVAVAPEGEVKS